MPNMVETDKYIELNKDQKKVARHFGYMGNIFPTLDLSEAYERATDIASRASSPSDATVCIGTLTNAYGVYLAKLCVPISTMSKLEIVNMLYGSCNTEKHGMIDFARPLSFDQECVKNGINPHWYVWCYPPGSFGQPLNLAEELINRMLNGRL